MRILVEREGFVITVAGKVAETTQMRFRYPNS
jgi:hypothetical protein